MVVETQSSIVNASPGPGSRMGASVEVVVVMLKGSLLLQLIMVVTNEALALHKSAGSDPSLI